MCISVYESMEKLYVLAVVLHYEQRCPHVTACIIAVSLEIMFILDDSARHNLSSMPAVSASAGGTVPFM